ncbi:RNA polymerase sigma factor [Streptomyces sp. NPDC002643]
MELSLRARIRAGDPEAFAQLFRAHASVVYSHAARLTADRAAAEDVVSLTFLEAWRLRERLLSDAEVADLDGGTDWDGDGDEPGGDGHFGGGLGHDPGGVRSLRPWLFGIATNVLRNTRRAARRHSAALARLPERRAERETVPDFADELVGRMEDADRLAAARVALGKLRKREREVFALCVWSGLSYAAAAEALDVPTSTVRSRLARARQRLRGLAEAELARQERKPGGRPEPATPSTPPRPPEPSTPPRPPERSTPPRPPEVRSGARRGFGSGQVPGGRTDAARSTQAQERNR